MNNDLLWKFLKFGVVGFSGVFVDFGITWVCRDLIEMNQYLANSTGFLFAVISNYFLNRFWTFNSQDPSMVKQFSKFLIASLIGLSINNGIIYLLNEQFDLNFYAAKLIATGVVTLWNFWANYTFTFKG